MLNVNVAYSDRAGTVNEDVVGFSEGAAWVIDGATGVGATLLDGPSDAAWLATQADGAFRWLLHDAPDITTRDLVRATIEHCRSALRREAARFAHEPHERPSAAFAMVRICGGNIEFATLGDCRIAYADPTGVARLFGETALTAIESRTIALAEQIMLQEPDITPADLKQALLPQLRENRSLMNTLDGYWVLGTEPEAAKHLDLTTIPAVAGQRLRWRAMAICGSSSYSPSRRRRTCSRPATGTAWRNRCAGYARSSGSRTRAAATRASSGMTTRVFSIAIIERRHDARSGVYERHLARRRRRRDRRDRRRADRRLRTGAPPAVQR